MSKCSDSAWPSIKKVQSRSLPEVHSSPAREPKTTRLLSSDSYFPIPERTSSSSARFRKEASRALRNTSESSKGFEAAAGGLTSGIDGILAMFDLPLRVGISSDTPHSHSSTELGHD